MGSFDASGPRLLPEHVPRQTAKRRPPVGAAPEPGTGDPGMGGTGSGQGRGPHLLELTMTRSIADQTVEELGGPGSVLVRQRNDHVELDRLLRELDGSTGRAQ